MKSGDFVALLHGHLRGLEVGPGRMASPLHIKDRQRAAFPLHAPLAVHDSPGRSVGHFPYSRSGRPRRWQTSHKSNANPATRTAYRDRPLPREDTSPNGAYVQARMKRSLDHVLLTVANLPFAGFAVLLLTWVLPGAIIASTSGDWHFDRQLRSGITILAAIGAAWIPIFVGTVLFLRGGNASPWLLWGPWPLACTMTFIFLTAPPFYPFLALAWCVTAASVAVALRYRRPSVGPPPLPAQM